jgi:hypothetical protein
MGKKDIVVLTEEQEIEKRLAIASLNNAMKGLAQAIIDCDAAGIPLADAFAAIGVEIPKFAQPMINLLADKLPSRNPQFVSTDT